MAIEIERHGLEMLSLSRLSMPQGSDRLGYFL